MSTAPAASGLEASINTYYFSMNNEKAPFAPLKGRQAVVRLKGN
jgi:hypothetical protein